MKIIDIIAKKRDKKILNQEEIEYFVNEYTKGNITDYQASALIMAIYINGMDYEETKNLTIAMAHSGEILDLSDISDVIIDKHSTGGVGDKITLIVMPIIATFGIPVAKMSGRGLGITGGTVDKLESIPGYKTDISIEEFKNNIKKIGISLIGQTKELAPADKKLYALRDVIACVDNIPLIASSIMSKKIAAGANKLVLEVTCGSGAFMKTQEEAEKLSYVMTKIGELAGIEIVCVITNMDEPIGRNVGNSLEIEEAVKALKGNMEEDVQEIVLTISAYILKLAGISNDIEENKKKVLENIKSGKAYEKFKKLVATQYGDISYLENIKKARYVIPAKADKKGYVKKLNAEVIGQVSVDLGAGRLKKEDSIDYTAGIVLEKKIGDKVDIGDVLAYIHYNKDIESNEAIENVIGAYEIAEGEPEKYRHILKIM